MSRPRVTQLMDLVLLEPRVQEEVLADEFAVGERSLRQLASEPIWGARHQRAREQGLA